MKRAITFAVILGFVFLSAATVKAQKDNPGQKDRQYSKILVTSKVVEALGRIGDIQARDILIKATRSKEFFIRAAAARALGRIQDKESIKLLRQLLLDENYLVRIQAAAALLELGQEDAAEMLLAFLKDSDSSIRAAAAAEAGAFGEKFLLALTEILQKDRNYMVRVKALEQLGDNQFEHALPHIRQALGDGNAYVRRAACYALGEIKDTESIPQLQDRLDDEEMRVRAAAKTALGKLNDSSRIMDFREDLYDEEPLLVATSYVALARLGEADILPIVLQAIIAPDNPTVIRTQAAEALSILRPEITKILQDVSEEAGILYNIPLKESVEFCYQADGRNLVLVLIEALSDSDNPLYLDAPLILQALESKIALPALREALLQENPELVAATAYVLGGLRDKQAIDNLIKAFEKYGI